MSGIDKMTIPEAMPANGPILFRAIYPARNARKISRIKRGITDNIGQS
jgi:hypothetical protein